MSYEVLMQDLQQKSNERIRQVWLEAKSNGDKFRTLKREELKHQETEIQGQLKDISQRVAVPILHKAEKKALLDEDAAWRRLSERLYSMAVSMLGQARKQEYEFLFAELVGELPEIAWENIRVNPADKELSSSFFPGAMIETDSAIIGGFIASADDGRYRVVNTLESRLEKNWPFILPHLLEQIKNEQNDSFAT